MKSTMQRHCGAMGGLYAIAACIGAAIVGTSASAEQEAQPSTQTQSAEASIDDIALRFGVRSSVLDISLSPDGTKLAWIAPGPNHIELLKVFDLSSDAGIQQIATNSEIHADLDYCDWVTNDRLVCGVSGMQETSAGNLRGFSRLFAISMDGSSVEMLTQRASGRTIGFNQIGGSVVALDVDGEEGQILMTRNWMREATAGSLIGNEKEGLGVDRVDTYSGRRRTHVQPDEGASRYVADENGDVRLKARVFYDRQGYLKEDRVYMVRRTPESRWERLDDPILNGTVLEDFSPVAVDAGRGVVLAYTKLNGYDAVIEIPISGPPEATLLAGRDDVDVGYLIRIGRQRRVVGVAYETEKLSVDYFDPELRSLASGLSRALPNTPLISVAGASADESRLLIIASSDTNPGEVYLYDKSTRALRPLLPMREYLEDQPMGQMRSVTYPASDGTEIPGFLTLPPGSDGSNLPAIVLPHGGPAARDYWGFDWLVQFFTARGYAVLQPNYRGSSGYGEAWFGRNGYQAWDIAIGDVNDAGRWLVSQGIANPDQLAIVGWSYGGYAALQSQVVDAQLYKAVVAIAPVTDLEYLREDARGYTNFRYRDRQLGEGPHIEAGSPRLHAASFQAPVALFHGTRDANVNVRHSQRMARALEEAGKSVIYTEFAELQHSLEDNKARTEMLTAIDQFLSAALAQ